MVRLSVDSLPDGWSAIVSEAARLPFDYVGGAVDGVLMRCSVSRLGPVVSYRFIVDDVAFKASTLDGLTMRGGERFTLPATRERLVEAMGRSVMWRAAGLMRAGERVVLEAAVMVRDDGLDVRLFTNEPQADEVLASE